MRENNDFEEDFGVGAYDEFSVLNEIGQVVVTPRFLGRYVKDMSTSSSQVHTGQDGALERIRAEILHGEIF